MPFVLYIPAFLCVIFLLGFGTYLKWLFSLLCLNIDKVTGCWLQIIKKNNLRFASNWQRPNWHSSCAVILCVRLCGLLPSLLGKAKPIHQGSLKRLIIYLLTESKLPGLSQTPCWETAVERLSFTHGGDSLNLEKAATVLQLQPWEEIRGP